MDTSYSMGERSDFEDDHFLDAEDEEEEIPSSVVRFAWRWP